MMTPMLAWFDSLASPKGGSTQISYQLISMCGHKGKGEEARPAFEAVSSQTSKKKKESTDITLYVKYTSIIKKMKKKSTTASGIRLVTTPV